MRGSYESIYHRINITLPKQTVRAIDRIVGKGRRSRLIDRAVRRYLRGEARANIRKQLAESYEANAAFDLKLAEDWFPLDEEAWQRENH